MAVPAWYNENEPHIAPLYRDQDMSSAQNKKNMTWYLNTMLNGGVGSFMGKEPASMSLVPCTQAAGSGLMERHKRIKVNK